MIEKAYYRLGEALGLPVWCQDDEGGPYQAIPQGGASWQPEGRPAPRAHLKYVRGGTAKLLTLLRPATGELCAEPLERTTNAILHPWLKQELSAILKQCPPAPATPPPGRRRWVEWRWHEGAAGLDRRQVPIQACCSSGITSRVIWVGRSCSSGVPSAASGFCSIRQ
jgi:hypothetical protein